MIMICHPYPWLTAGEGSRVWGCFSGNLGFASLINAAGVARTEIWHGDVVPSHVFMVIVL
jgi:hypothetical protein